MEIEILLLQFLDLGDSYLKKIIKNKHVLSEKLNNLYFFLPKYKLKIKIKKTIL